MPQKLDSFPPDWDSIEDEFQHIPIYCPWTIASDDKKLSVIITCLKWIFNYDLWMRVALYPEEQPHLSKQADIWDHSSQLESLSEALFKYYASPEPQMNCYQLHIFGELLDYLDSKFPQIKQNDRNSSRQP